MKIRKLALVLMFIPVFAFAGKAERDFTTSEAEPAVKEAVATLKNSCGCDVAFDVKFDTFKDLNELWLVKRFANAIKDGAEPYCSDAASKAAMCNLKTIEFSKGSDVTFEFKDGKGTATADSSSYPSWDMVTRAVDK
ncbi:MAG: hypothetical protein ABI127_09790 [Dokdonella sp.]